MLDLPLEYAFQSVNTFPAFSPTMTWKSQRVSSRTARPRCSSSGRTCGWPISVKPSSMPAASSWTARRSLPKSSRSSYRRSPASKKDRRQHHEKRTESSRPSRRHRQRKSPRTRWGRWPRAESPWPSWRHRTWKSAGTRRWDRPRSESPRPCWRGGTAQRRWAAALGGRDRVPAAVRRLQIRRGGRRPGNDQGINRKQAWGRQGGQG